MFFTGICVFIFFNSFAQDIEVKKFEPLEKDQTAKWTRLAAEKGYRSAQDNMGWCYENGKGVPQNYSEAVRWYKLAAKQNSSYAIKQLKRLNEM